MTRTRPARSRDEGATAVEMALILPVVFTVVFFTLYGAMFVYYSAIADHVAQKVAREVSIPTGSTGSSYPDAVHGLVSGDVSSAAGGLIPTPQGWSTTSLPSTGEPQEGDLVTVSVTYHLPVLSQLSSLVPGLTGIDSVTRSATERRQ
jgi:Flp pilus assembly protein TadG